MNKLIRYSVLGGVMSLALFLGACSPQTDTTNPLSDYQVNVSVPFATNTAAYSTKAPEKPQYTISTQTSVKIIGWMNETLDSGERDAYVSLSVGSIGTNVKNLQKRLIELGYMTGTASGTFDQATAQAVRLFEAAYGQKETGTASPLMQVYLFSGNAKTYTGLNVNSTQNPESGSAYTTLERGMTGSGVVRLQNRLIELGYMSGNASGIFDTNTENAVKEFEAAYGKQRTGIATESLQSYLYSSGAYRADRVTPAPGVQTPAPTDAVSGAYPPLQYGSRGENVARLQKRLKELGYYSGSIDKIYGNATVKAVKAFEAAYGQMQTGVATSVMQSYLYAPDARPYSAAVVTPTPTPAVYQTLSEGS